MTHILWRYGLTALLILLYVAGWALAFQGGRAAEWRAHRDGLNNIDNQILQCAKSAVKRLRPTQLAAIAVVARSPMCWPGLMAFCRMHHVESELARKHKRAA